MPKRLSITFGAATLLALLAPALPAGETAAGLAPAQATIPEEADGEAVAEQASAGATGEEAPSKGEPAAGEGESADDKASLEEPAGPPISHLIEVPEKDAETLSEELEGFEAIRMGILLYVQLCRENPQLEACKFSTREIEFLSAHLEKRISRLTSGNLLGVEDMLDGYRNLLDLLAEDRRALQLALIGRPDASEAEIEELWGKLEKELEKYEIALPQEDDASELVEIDLSETPAEGNPAIEQPAASGDGPPAEQALGTGEGSATATEDLP